MKKCPLSHEECTSDCGLYIAPNDLNELMATRLTSIGVFNAKDGICSLKMLALSSGRFMFENVYIDSPAKMEEKKSRNIIKALFEYYSDMLKQYCDEDKIQRAVTDYIASMTDSYAIEKYKDIFIPKPLAMPQKDDNLIKLARMI